MAMRIDQSRSRSVHQDQGFARCRLSLLLQLAHADYSISFDRDRPVLDRLALHGTTKRERIIIKTRETLPIQPAPEAPSSGFMILRASATRRLQASRQSNGSRSRPSQSDHRLDRILRRQRVDAIVPLWSRFHRIVLGHPLSERQKTHQHVRFFVADFAASR